MGGGESGNVFDSPKIYEYNLKLFFNIIHFPIETFVPSHNRDWNSCHVEVDCLTLEVF